MTQEEYNNLIGGCYERVFRSLHVLYNCRCTNFSFYRVYISSKKSRRMTQEYNNLTDEEKKALFAKLEQSVCGNIYKDPGYNKGYKYYGYTVDCALCVNDEYLDDVGKYKRAKTSARERGWKLIHGKWVCPDCLRAKGVVE